MASTYISEFPTYEASGTGKGEELSPDSSAFGRKAPFVFIILLGSEWPVLVRADVQPENAEIRPRNGCSTLGSCH